MKHLSLLLFSLLLAACGGGGGGGYAGPVASTSTFQLKQAYANNFNQTASQTWTASGTAIVNGVTVQISGNGLTTQSAVTNTFYDGAPAQQKSQTASGTLVVTDLGQSSSFPFPTTTVTLYVNQAFDPVGSSTGGLFTFATGPAAIPFTARVGDAGHIGTFETYGFQGQPVGPVLGRTSFSYSVEADTANTAILRISQTGTDAAGVVQITQFEIFQITPEGSIVRLAGSATVVGQSSATFTYYQ